jgi:hypothetical protein
VSDDQRLFEEVSRQLRAALATMTTEDNPAAKWLFSSFVACGAVVLCSSGLLIFAISLMR